MVSVLVLLGYSRASGGPEDAVRLWNGLAEGLPFTSIFPAGLELLVT